MHVCYVHDGANFTNYKITCYYSVRKIIGIIKFAFAKKLLCNYCALTWMLLSLGLVYIVLHAIAFFNDLLYVIEAF